ncbi:unnamed protein product [Mytilus coruscus]|uniref:Uncharacterized protein n=1 Tax=Mytilus coruscus TaxID=42192 RepID=A0A6J8EDA0_MYTCO|nr:unnamed protein product [Mytilus coruscus]
MIFYFQCLDQTIDTCFSCIGLEEQDTIDYSLSLHQTEVKQNLDFSQNLNKTKENQQLKQHNYGHKSMSDNFVPVVQNKHMLSLNLSKVTTSLDSHSKTDTLNENNMSTKGKELRTLELKLKKKEEQLKIKEAMLNEDMKEKTKIIERLHKAEIRNIELENTTKTLQTRIEQLPMQSSPSYDKPTHVHSYNNEGDDELIIGMRKRVTEFVLGRIDNELNKLESNFDNTWSQNDQTRANMYQHCNIVETPNYSHNHWNYDHAYSQQHRNYNHIHPQQHGEIQSQNIAHEN